MDDIIENHIQIKKIKFKYPKYYDHIEDMDTGESSRRFVNVDFKSFANNIEKKKVHKFRKSHHRSSSWKRWRTTFRPTVHKMATTPVRTTTTTTPTTTSTSTTSIPTTTSVINPTINYLQNYVKTGKNTIIWSFLAIKKIC